jgi:hypothetical protein
VSAYHHSPNSFARIYPTNMLQAPCVGADADDTAKTILTLNLLNIPTSPDTLIQEYESESHFKTYQQERDPSFSANCNVLNAFLHCPDPSQYAPQIGKALHFLCTTFRQDGNTVRDKWVRQGVLHTSLHTHILYNRIFPHCTPLC